MNGASGRSVLPSTESMMSAGQLMFMMSFESPASNRSSVHSNFRATNPQATMIKRMIIVDSALKNVSTTLLPRLIAGIILPANLKNNSEPFVR